MNKGIKRLAILLGGLAALAWWVFIAVDSFRHGPPLSQWEWRFWMIDICSIALSFLIPFGLVHAIAWIVRNKKIVIIVALLLLIAGAVRFALIKREDLVFDAERLEILAGDSDQRINADRDYAESVDLGHFERYESIAQVRYEVLREKMASINERQDWNHSVLGFFLPALKIRHSTASSYSPLPVQPKTTQPDTAPQDKNNCLIVATVTYAQLKNTAYWARIAGFAYSKGEPGHAVVLFQPTKKSTVWLYDAAGSRDLQTQSHDLSELAKAITGWLKTGERVSDITWIGEDNTP